MFSDAYKILYFFPDKQFEDHHNAQKYELGAFQQNLGL
ncbi:hypothetical protein J2T04_003155 [Chryseobacterium lathyri]|uniref:Uncharacterized protein n=1 Tax=Chryseobacterium lathyri TaxID=395933 RepID=A0ABT9SQJ8_9FLAO|nr:hypothetical protein [Chryseobacterium lathyri]